MEVRRCQPWLGTYVEIRVSGEGSERALHSACADAFTAIRRVHEAMSIHDPDSELSRINRTAHKGFATASAAINEVLREALDVSRMSDDTFDVTVGGVLARQHQLPDHGDAVDRAASWRDIELLGDRVRFHRPLRIDLGGIAKGYAVDQALAALPPELDACVNAGGDLRMRNWQDRFALVRSPLRRDNFHRVAMRNAALASSADPNPGRYGVMVGPDRRRRRRKSAVWSVFAATAMRADALTKVLRLHPSPAPILRNLGAEGAVLHADGRWQEAVCG